MNFKYNTKQRKTSIQGLRSFKETLPTEARRILNKKGQIFNKTLDNWKYIVGGDLFKVCYPKSFKSSNKLKKSTLNIMVKRGNEINLEYSKGDIIKRINAFFGHQVVENVRLNTFDGQSRNQIEKNVSNATKNKHLKKISDIKNEKIKNSLIELSKLLK
tara:strand:+ start:123 stop:599 length:477 start_codon:yes stop_codon:yes gene_type:complete